MIGEINTKPQTGGIDIQGIINQYQVEAGENISAGDFVEFINEFPKTSNLYIDNNLYSKFDNKSAIKLDTNKVFIAFEKYENNYYYPYGVICTINNSTITTGEIVKLANPSTSSLETGTIYRITAVNLSSTNVFIAFGYGTSDRPLLGIVACTINGTTITAGSMARVGNSGNAENIKACVFNNNYVFIAHGFYTDFSTMKLLGSVILVNGTATTTKVTGIVLEQSTSSTTLGRGLSIAKLDSNRVLISYNYNGSSLKSIVCTVGTTSISKGTDVLISSSSTVAISPNIMDMNYFLTNTQSGSTYDYAFLVAKPSTTSDTRILCKILKINGSSISVEKSTYLQTKDGWGSAYQCYLSSIFLNDNEIEAKFFIAYTSYHGDMSGMTVNCSKDGFNVSIETDNVLSHDNSYSNGQYLSSVLIDTDIVFVLGYIATRLGAVIVDSVSIQGLRTITSTNDEILGIAQQSGSGGNTINVIEPYTS